MNQQLLMDKKIKKNMATKKHKCLDRIRARVMGNNKAIKDMWFDLANIRSVADNKIEGEEKTAQKIWVTETGTKKSGEKFEKQYTSFIAHKFCPFCGKEYNKN